MTERGSGLPVPPTGTREMFMEEKSREAKLKHEAKGWRLVAKLFLSLVNVLGWTGVEMFKWE